MEEVPCFLDAVRRGDGKKDALRIFTVSTALCLLHEVEAVVKYSTPTKESVSFFKILVNAMLEGLATPVFFFPNTHKAKQLAKKTAKKLRLLYDPQQLRDVVQNKDKDVGGTIIAVLGKEIRRTLASFERWNRIMTVVRATGQIICSLVDLGSIIYSPQLFGCY